MALKAPVFSFNVWDDRRQTYDRFGFRPPFFPTTTMLTVTPSFEDSAFYLGRPDEVLENVTWKRYSDRNLLIIKTSAAYADVSPEAPVSSDNEDDSADLDAEPANLNCVVTIGHDGCWMTPCGNWPIGSTYAKELAAIRLNCQALAPQDSKYATHYTRTVDALRRIVDLIKTPGYTQKGFMSQGSGGFKLRHIPFEQVKPGEQLVGSHDLEVWPARQPEARNAIRLMLKEGSHVVHGIRAYDRDGRLITPEDYMSKLRGVTVMLTMNLSHIAFQSKKEDLVSADIVKMRIIANQSTAPSPLKRGKLALHDSEDEEEQSPTKKKRSVYGA
ncbi:unnamed protein product [Mycena citricolor]|uniref:Uncharacterized protein n=3 Tax=Mycena citricolor TaxID=2018698 RepID=A0AAD2HFP5_9AGAR|nr:unnamed protein product [Mycena citricolor]